MIQLYTWNTALEVYRKGEPDLGLVLCIPRDIWEGLAKIPRNIASEDTTSYMVLDDDRTPWFIPKDCAYKIPNSLNFQGFRGII